jgi:hypothetical protein
MARLGLAQAVRDCVEQTFERWDGKGVPKGAKEEEILVTSRLVTLADVIEVFHRAGGTDRRLPGRDHPAGTGTSTARARRRTGNSGVSARVPPPNSVRNRPGDRGRERGRSVTA